MKCFDISVAKTKSMIPCRTTLYVSRSRCLNILTRSSDVVSLKPSAAWWFSRTVISLYSFASSLLELHKNALYSEIYLISLYLSQTEYDILFKWYSYRYILTYSFQDDQHRVSLLLVSKSRHLRHHKCFSAYLAPRRKP